MRDDTNDVLWVPHRNNTYEDPPTKGVCFWLCRCLHHTDRRVWTVWIEHNNMFWDLQTILYHIDHHCSNDNGTSWSVHLIPLHSQRPQSQYDHVCFVLRYDPRIAVILGSPLHPTGKRAGLQCNAYTSHPCEDFYYFWFGIVWDSIKAKGKPRVTLIWSAINDFHCCMEAILTSHYTVQRESKTTSRRNNK